MTIGWPFARLPADQARDGRVDVLAGSQMVARLERFYLSLTFDARRRRFKGGVSDASIRMYCSAIDTSCCFAVGLIRDSDFCAVMEVHAPDRAFESAELTVSCGRQVECHHLLAHFVQIAAFEAAKRGCAVLVVEADDCTAVLLDVLREVGRREPGGLIGFDIGDYAIGRNATLARSRGLR